MAENAVIVSMTEARASLGKLMESVVQEGKEVIVTRNGFHYVRLVAIASPDQIEKRPADLPTQSD